MSRRGSLAGEVGGASADLGTLLPIMLGAIAVAGLAPGGVLTGFGVFLIAMGFFFRLPLPVQPMKAIGAVILTGGLSSGEVAAGVRHGSMRQPAAVDATATGDRTDGLDPQRQARGGAGVRPER